MTDKPQWIAFTEKRSYLPVFDGNVRVLQVSRITPKCVFTSHNHWREERHMKADILYQLFDTEDEAREVQTDFMKKTQQAAEGEVLARARLGEADALHTASRQKAIAELFEEQLNERE